MNDFKAFCASVHVPRTRFDLRPHSVVAHSRQRLHFERGFSFSSCSTLDPVTFMA